MEKQIELQQMSNNQLICSCVCLEKEAKQRKRLLDSYKAELQERGLEIIDNQNIRYVKFYASEGSCAITDSMTLDPLNIDKLKKLLGEGLFQQKVIETTETKYKFDKKLETALKAIFMGYYYFDATLEEFLDEMSIKPDPKQKKLLLKKLRGDYAKDKDTLCSVFGFSEGEAPDLDVELWYIYNIKNTELIRAFLPTEGISSIIDQIKKCIMVESKTAITIDYDKEAE